MKNPSHPGRGGGPQDSVPLAGVVDDKRARQLLDNLLSQAHRERASDIHILPQRRHRCRLTNPLRN